VDYSRELQFDGKFFETVRPMNKTIQEKDLNRRSERNPNKKSR
jgi:hypothetical protein